MNLENPLKFLKALNENNSKEWMDANRDWYLEAKSEFISFTEYLIQGLLPFAPGLTGLKGKECIFRINRDIRFSQDKRPYKNNFGAAISEGGKKSDNPAYYFHLQPSENFIGGGIYMPPAETLKKIRQEVDYNPEELKNIAGNKDFQALYGEIKGGKLKTAPKGYPKDHPNIEFLKLKSYVVMSKLSDQEVATEGFEEKAIEYFRIMKPFNDYLSVAVS